MKSIPEKVNTAWNSRQEAIVFSTVDKNGMPNSIYATCTSKFNDSIVVVADNFFHKTRENILTGSKASILFITKEGTSYQLKGTIKYYTSGEIYEDMKNWNLAHLPGNAAAALEFDEVYSGSERLV
jgi:predicted pyridoxine 5'-phosphate oxidase superfamily flavin-nucleotide-binding protein